MNETKKMNNKVSTISGSENRAKQELSLNDDLRLKNSEFEFSEKKTLTIWKNEPILLGLRCSKLTELSYASLLPATMICTDHV